MKTLYSRLLRCLLSAVVLLCSVACEHTFIDDLFQIHREVDQLKESHRDLQQRIDNINESIVTLQALVDILLSGYYIESVSPVINGTQTSYMIRFTNGQTIEIHNGTVGADAPSPVIGVIQENGRYYWTVNGEPLLDDSGNMIPVSSDSVKTPIFNISNGYWYVSYDSGDTWRIVGPATGQNGFNGEDGVQNVIRVDDSSTDVVVFVLADGTTLTIPYRVEIHLFLDSEEDAYGIYERETIRVKYRLSSATEDTQINVSTDGYYSAKVVQDDELSGSILITCPRTYSDGYVNVLVFDKSGVVDTHIIRFYERRMDFSEGLEFTAPPEGGTVSVPFSVNFSFEVKVDEAAESWLTVVSGSGAGDGQIVVSAAANKDLARTGAIFIIPENGNNVLASIFITQQSSLCTIDIGSFVISYEGGTVLSNINTTYGVTASFPQEDVDWLKVEVLPQGGDDYTVAITAEPNTHELSRSSVVDICSSDGNTKLALLRVMQNGRFLDLEYAMIFVVRPNYSNDFTAYLPIDIYNSYDCYVDWGDGTGQRYCSADNFQSLPDGQRNIHHKYEGLTVGRSFEVVVSGTVTSLSSSQIPEALRSSVTEVKQWGKTGLTQMDNAFEGFTGLTTLHLDETGAFENVTSFNQSFAGCPRLVTISEHLFDYATSAESFNNTFQESRMLAVIPENLFRNAKAAKYFYGTFSRCQRLVSIPEQLFAECSEATQFDYTFERCGSLKSIPSGLFAHNNKALYFNSTFRDCSSLSEIPDGLFDGNPDAFDFYGTFAYCNLKAIPTHLLDNQRKITNFQEIFCGGYNIESESPWTMVNGKKVHLYERHLYPDAFVTPISFRACFVDCHMMPDYDSIPDDWKNWN